jgi:hypothetical protein
LAEDGLVWWPLSKSDRETGLVKEFASKRAGAIIRIIGFGNARAFAPMAFSPRSA